MFLRRQSAVGRLLRDIVQLRMLSASDPKRTFLLRGYSEETPARYRLARISTSRSTYRHSAVLRSRRTNSSKASACSGASRTKSESRMALQVLGCDADVSLRPAGIPYQLQCAEIAPRRWLGVHLALSPTKLPSSGSE